MKLFAPFALGPFPLKHRVVMPPLTRMRADADGVPSPLAATYYGQRASEGGLVIAEATQISQQGQGYPQTPGIVTDNQVVAWQRVTQAVKARGAVMFLQLWHVGRISHSSFQRNGSPPVAPSAIQPAGNAFTSTFARVPYETPHALDVNEIAAIVADFRKAAENAKAAGFDGVEIHGANGYLLQQFLEDKTNHRTDRYGGSIENRARLLFEVIDAVADVWPLERIGVRLSPYCNVGDIADSDPQTLYRYVIGELSERGIAYLHLIESQTSWASASVSTTQRETPKSIAALFRPYFKGPLIASGGFTRESAERTLVEGHADLIAFGRPFIANPDLPDRLKRGASLNEADQKTFYGGAEHGYTDYRELAETAL
ncbi:MAG: alkene reductase [Paraburkholderia tropica]|uniref:N-ethylmaleimide reductase n=1 Tax=Paraburkholderia tropica TaxID=92647 RepID=A0AAQ1JX23_9BURK|nr:alkene reductase [Paraburkholderia tropica]MBB3003137.1 N-ethylmaleimide reductase [Paraburkholderia tropica]MBB6322010.1 N-ethylmaleimide reductase [Paraburkholderia tropica]MDE1138265.1 alkene reductase [Paraburkholderia tropica]PXX12657.1 N-ethylmaleimide reductase [Paraburkholderia tropica]PZW77494.1 N-ethylmaleimide reductase [Paraburkholderia tropica]